MSRNTGIKAMGREVAEAQEWVSTIMETPWEGTFEEYLKDGQVRPFPSPNLGRPGATQGATQGASRGAKRGHRTGDGVLGGVGGCALRGGWAFAQILRTHGDVWAMFVSIR